MQTELCLIVKDCRPENFTFILFKKKKTHSSSLFLNNFIYLMYVVINTTNNILFSLHINHRLRYKEIPPPPYFCIN